MLKKLQTALNFHPQEIELTQKTLLTREGKAVDISGDIWQLPYSSRSSSTLRFDRISDKLIKESLIAHVTDRIIRVSTHAGYTAYNDAWREILRHWNINHKENTKNELIELF